MLRDFVKYHIGDDAWKYCFSTKVEKVQLIIDSRTFSHLLDDIDIIFKIKKHSISLCYKLHKRTLSLLSNMINMEEVPGDIT